MKELTESFEPLPLGFGITAKRLNGRLVLADNQRTAERVIIDRKRGIISRNLGAFCPYRTSVQVLDEIARAIVQQGF